MVNDHVSVRNWPPPPYPHTATESANVIKLAAANEKALVQYVLDVSTWSFICLFLELFDTFNMRTALTTWNSAAKDRCGERPFSCCRMHLGIMLADMYKKTVQCYAWVALPGPP